MKLYLVLWPPEITSGETSLFIGGDLQWKGLGNMKTYLADTYEGNLIDDQKGLEQNMRMRILISYHYYRNTDLEELLQKNFEPPYPEIFADSGAFSAMTQGDPISLDEYMEWLDQWKHLFETYANLDIIKDAEATWQNQVVMEKSGFEPLPVFHVLEDWKYLERYLERYHYIGLGVAGMQNRKKSLMAWLVRCFKMAQNETYYHGFGLTGWKVLKSFPWYSVDSSSWGQGFRFGRVPIFDRKRGKFVKLELGDRKAWGQYAGLIRDMGFDPEDFANRDRNEREKICAISALSYKRAELWITQIHGPQILPTGERGNKIYLTESTTGGRDIASAIRILNHE